LTPFVGRAAPLGALLEVVAQVRQGRGQAVGIVGEPGMGKSRLVLELRHGLVGERVTSWRAGASPSARPRVPAAAGRHARETAESRRTILRRP